MDEFFDFDDDDDINVFSFDDDYEDIPESNIKLHNLINMAMLDIDDKLPFGDQETHVYEFLSSLTNVINSEIGMPGIFMLMQAVERETGWSLEIIGSKSDIESYVYEKHNLFDDDIWAKAKNTHAWDEMVHQVFRTTTLWLPEITREALGSKPTFKTKLFRAIRALTRRS